MERLGPEAVRPHPRILALMVLTAVASNQKAMAAVKGLFGRKDA